VTLTVTNYPSIQASPGALTFLYQTGQAVPTAQVINVTSSTGEVLNYTVAAVTSSGGNWLSAAPASGATPGQFNAGVSTTGLAPGTYTGTITMVATNPSGAPAPNNPLTIPVTYYVSAHALIAVSPASVNLTAVPSSTPTSPTAMVSLTSTSTALDYTAIAKTNAGGNWLAIGSSPGITPTSFQITALAAALSPGTYTGNITITALNPDGSAVADSPFVVLVTLLVATGTLSASPASLTFTQYTGGGQPASQTLSVSATAVPLNFVAVASNSSGINWLTVSPASGTTPASLTVSANSAGLSSGTYSGAVTITSTGAEGSPLTIPVTFGVGEPLPPSISLAPAGMGFNYQIGGNAPATQATNVTSTAANFAFTAAASTAAGTGNWLSFTSTSGMTPALVTVSVNPTGLAAGTYDGAITITAADAVNSPQQLKVTLTVSPPLAPAPTVVVNAASQQPGPVAPGEIISIYGTVLGPAQGVGGIITNNSLATTLAGITVNFDNNPAPLLYVSATQINALVPFELTGRFETHMQILDDGVASAALDLDVAAAAPALFTVAENGSGQGAILNTNTSANSASNPAAPGSIIVLYATGAGQTTPPGVTGNITPDNGSGLKMVPGLTVTVGNQPCDVVYAGSAPGFIEGAVQVNCQLPASVPAGSQTVVMSVGGVSSPATVTVAVE